MDNATNRVIIEKVSPQVAGGDFPIKRVVGESVRVVAHVFTDGHDSISANLLFRTGAEKQWQSVALQPLGNDEWQAEFVVACLQPYYYTVEAWVNQFQTWQKDVMKRADAGQDIHVYLDAGKKLLAETIRKGHSEHRGWLESWFKKINKEKDPEKLLALIMNEELSGKLRAHPDEQAVAVYGKTMMVSVCVPRSRFSAWYELFPRSCSAVPGRHGTLKDCERLIPQIAAMGFDVVYLPPIHPIGSAKRKGKNNSVTCGPAEPGSPWAIGSAAGGHMAIHKELGSLQDFKSFVKTARAQGVELAMDLAFQCSPDHPYVKEHPEWFRWRPDGTVQYAENPPKKYEDIIPFDFDTKDRQALWDELKRVVLFWTQKGVRVFRVDNPHTKPFAFWEWLIKEVTREYADVMFLAEAFTRPKVMYRLAKIGFHQSYTYFTWRNTKRELMTYLEELANSGIAEYFQPNFWPNTPDILPEYLQHGGRPAFIIRAILAATLSSSYGMYGPAYELCVAAAIPGKEEYLDSEKYELKHWDRSARGNLTDVITLINRIRRENPALQATRNVVFCEVDNERLIAFGKRSPDGANSIIVVVNIDPFHSQSGWVRVPLAQLGVDAQQQFLVHDLLSNDKYIWQGERNYVELNPQSMPAHILRIYPRLKREQDFDYYV